MIKYIINSLENQSITGNLNLNGNFRVGDGTYSIGTYRALLTQTATQSATNMQNLFGYLFIVGETYTIVNYVEGDDFSNIADVISGSINQTGCEFIATGEVPSNWSSGSEIVSSGNLVVDVIENNLGFDIIWEKGFSSGIYFGFKSNTGPLYNSFPKRQVMITTQQTAYGYGPPELLSFYSVPASIGDVDDAIVLAVFNWDNNETVNDRLYYTPIEISFKQDFDLTPIVATGSISSEYPIYYASVNIYSDGNYVTTIFADNQSNSDNLSELVALLNGDINTSYLGVFSDDGEGGIQVTIPTNVKNQFSKNGTLTFEVFND